MRLTFSILFTLISIISLGQKENLNETSKKINTYLSEIEKVGFNGSVIIELNGEIYSKGFGFSDKEKALRNTSQTVFDIGSLTKQFTSAAILKLEMQARLSTEDKISKYFPNIPNDKQTITIHHLLRHRSGLVDNIGDDYDKITKDEFLKQVFDEPLSYEIGSTYFYSNVGYSLLAMIIEQVSEKSYEEYLYDNIWKPAQMEMTGYSRPHFIENLIANGYNEKDSIWGKPNDKPWDNKAPFWHLKGNGGILSTTEDMYKWHRALKSNIALSDEAVKKLYYPTLTDNETTKYYYGYGWVVENTARNTRKISHNGSNGIFFADFHKFIDEDIMILHLTNNLHPNFSNLNQELGKIIFYSDYIPAIPIEDNKTNRSFTDRIVEIIAKQGLENAKSEYALKNSNKNILEFVMRQKGSEYLKNNQNDIAIQIFQMNLHAFPNSSRALQGLGIAYNKLGNKDLALKYLNESLRINPENYSLKEYIEKIEN